MVQTSQRKLILPSLQITDSQSDMLQETYSIYTDPDESSGSELVLTPNFCKKHGLQPLHVHHENEPSSKKKQASKRRLTLHQKRTLERSYCIDNKLEPAQKNKLALELGLQPRQIAIWYQNRRARSKAKSIEGKYAALKLQYQEAISKTRKLEAEVTSLREKLQAKAKMQPDSATETSRIDHDYSLVNQKETQTAAEISGNIDHDYCLLNQKQSQNAAPCKHISSYPTISRIVYSSYNTDAETMMKGHETELESAILSKTEQNYVSFNNNISLMNIGTNPVQANCKGLACSYNNPMQEGSAQCVTEARFHPQYSLHEPYNLSSLINIGLNSQSPVEENEEYLAISSTDHLDEQLMMFDDQYPSIMQHDFVACLYCNLAASQA